MPRPTVADLLGLGTVGIWSRQLRSGSRFEVAASAAELEALGFGALWVPGRVGGDVFGASRDLLGATSRIVVATGIVNIWAHEASEVSAACSALDADHPGRFVLGLGVSHKPLVAKLGRTYKQPIDAMSRYLDELDRRSPAVSPGRRVLGALGPKMLNLASNRAAGAHPYLTTVEHTERARQVLGVDRVLAPELHAVLEAAPSRARQLVRRAIARNLELPNYASSFRRQGFSEEDLQAGGSDRLIDALAAWGKPGRIAARIREHLDAGADHVCVQVLHDGDDPPLAQWRVLADVLATEGVLRG